MPKNARRQNPTPKKGWRPHPDDKKPIFVRSELDDYGLNLYEFRVLAHVVRRESKDRGCDESQANMAKICGMSQRMVLEVLRVLCDARILRKDRSPKRRTNVYRLNPGSKWKDPSELETIRKREKNPQSPSFSIDISLLEAFKDFKLEVSAESDKSDIAIEESSSLPDLWK